MVTPVHSEEAAAYCSLHDGNQGSPLRYQREIYAAGTLRIIVVGRNLGVGCVHMVEFRNHRLVDGLFKNPRINVTGEGLLRPGGLITWLGARGGGIRTGLIIGAVDGDVNVMWNEWLDTTRPVDKTIMEIQDTVIEKDLPIITATQQRGKR